MSSKKNNKRPSSSISSNIDPDQTTLQVTKTSKKDNNKETVKEILIKEVKPPVKLDYERVLVELANAGLKEEQLRKNKINDQKERAENYVKLLKSKSTTSKKYDDIYITKSGVTSFNPKYINAWNEERKEFKEKKLKFRQESDDKKHLIPPHVIIPKDEIPVPPEMELTDFDKLKKSRKEKELLAIENLKYQIQEQEERHRILYRWRNYYIDDPKLKTILV